MMGVDWTNKIMDVMPSMIEKPNHWSVWVVVGLVLAAAIVVWWCMQPKAEEDALAGGEAAAHLAAMRHNHGHGHYL